MTRQVNVIYTRSSSDLQRSDSDIGQERRCRDALERMGIPQRGFIFVADEAIGSRDGRAGFQMIKELISAGRLGVLVVTEMSRLSRSTNATELIQDIVFQGGRFISLSENIDTDRKG